MHSFKEKGYEFDSGLHYIAEGSGMKIMNMLGAKKIELHKLNPYDKYQDSPTDKGFEFVAGVDNHIEKMINEYPDNAI